MNHAKRTTALSAVALSLSITALMSLGARCDVTIDTAPDVAHPTNPAPTPPPVHPPTPDLPPSPKPGPDIRLVPWMEFGSPLSSITRWGKVRPDVVFRDPTITYLDHCIEGLLPWSKVADRVIVLTQPAQIDRLYPALMRAKPEGLRIIGGLKLFELNGDFAASNGWMSIAASAKRVASMTGTNIVVLDGETVLTPFHTGNEPIDFDRLRMSLSALRETGIEFWWHPVRVLGDSKSMPDRERQTTRLVQTIAEALPDAVFLTAYTSWYGYEKNRVGELTLRDKMIVLVGKDRMHDRFFATPDGHVYFRGGGRKRSNTVAESIVRLAANAQEGVVVDVYPGAEAWVAVAKEFAAQQAAVEASLGIAANPCRTEPASKACREKMLSTTLVLQGPAMQAWAAADCATDPEGESCQYAALRATSSLALIREAAEQYPTSKRGVQAADFNANGRVDNNDLDLVIRLRADKTCVRGQGCNVSGV